MCLFDGIDGVPLLLQVPNGVQGLFIVLPFDGFFGTECGLMQFLIWRTAADTAEDDAFNTHRVSRTKNGTHVMLTAHVIQHHHQRQFVCLPVLVHVHATHLSGCKFLTHSAKGKLTCRICSSSSI